MYSIYVQYAFYFICFHLLTLHKSTISSSIQVEKNLTVSTVDMWIATLVEMMLKQVATGKCIEEKERVQTKNNNSLTNAMVYVWSTGICKS